MGALNTGIDQKKAKHITDGLAKVLADTYTLSLKTLKYHWNVTGPMFHSLHILFEDHYKDLNEAIDDLAERIRVFGIKAPGSYTEFMKVSSVKEDPSLDCKAEEMIKNLLKDHEQVTRTAKDVLLLLEGANDEGTQSLLGSRIEYHEKTAWMLKSMLS